MNQPRSSKSQLQVFVPSRGVRYLNTIKYLKNTTELSFRPLSGSKVSELCKCYDELFCVFLVFVPSRGVRYLNGYLDAV